MFVARSHVELWYEIGQPWMANFDFRSKCNVYGHSRQPTAKYSTFFRMTSDVHIFSGKLLKSEIGLLGTLFAL